MNISRIAFTGRTAVTIRRHFQREMEDILNEFGTGRVAKNPCKAISRDKMLLQDPGWLGGILSKLYR